MANEDIPKSVVDFLAEHIDSVVQLEVLLLLQSRRHMNCHPADVAKELRIDREWTEAAMEKLAAAGILQAVPPAYRYAPRTSQLEQTIDDLAVAYNDRRVSIIGVIFSKPPDPIRHFSDAFRFRKEEGG